MKKYNGILMLERTVGYAHIPEDVVIEVVRRALGDLATSMSTGSGSDITAMTGDLIVHAGYIPETEEIDVFVGRLEFTAVMPAKHVLEEVAEDGQEAGAVP